MDKYSKLINNTALVFAGNLGARVISLLMLPLYTRWLSVEQYGLVDVLTMYVSFLLGIVTCCMADALFVFPKNEPYLKQRTYFSSGISLNVLTVSITAVIFFIIQIISFKLNISNSFIQNIWLIYFMLLSNIVQQLLQQFARSTDHMIVYSFTGLVYTFGVAVFAFLLIPKYGVAGYVWSIIASNFISAIYTLIGSKAYKYFQFGSVERDATITMLKYSLPLVPNGLMWWLVNAINRPIMEHYLGMHEIGIYAVANKFPGIMSMIFMVFSISWQISVLEEYGKVGYSTFFNKILRLVFFTLIIVLICISFASKFLINIFTNESYYNAWQYIPLLTLSTLFSSFSGFFGTIFSAVRKSKYYLYSSIWGAFTSLILNFILIPKLGLWGACLSVVFSFVVMTVSRIIYSWKYVSIENIAYYVLIIAFTFLFIFCGDYLQSNILKILVGIGMVLVMCYYDRSIIMATIQTSWLKIMQILNRK